MKAHQRYSQRLKSQNFPILSPPLNFPLMNVCDEVSLAVEGMEGQILLFVVIKPLCMSALLFFKSLLITNQFALLI